ncbi:MULTISPECIES: cytochrome C [Roseovarius]|uniref:c-type cytochrome n=1 Tax=Roseovarius TaxID=74030 RepID=UPI001C0C6B93|nr:MULTISPECIES: cytochrome C [Roseovarius]MBU3258638.1 cytochrome C [Roseovarius sp. PS-C2]MDW3119154.1 cytochrome C [Roseovarius pacificus]
MKTLITATAAMLALAAPALAEGDAAAGEKEFRKCKSCHMIESPAGESIVKGGRVGPNLYGIIGRTAGTVEDFRYGEALAAKGEEGLVWDQENIVEYMKDPAEFIGGRSKMTFKLRKGGEDVAAYLATFSE